MKKYRIHYANGTVKKSPAHKYVKASPDNVQKTVGWMKKHLPVFFELIQDSLSIAFSSEDNSFPIEKYATEIPDTVVLIMDPDAYNCDLYPHWRIFEEYTIYAKALGIKLYNISVMESNEFPEFLTWGAGGSCYVYNSKGVIETVEQEE